MDLTSGLLPGIPFRGQNLLLCKFLLFSDQNFRRRGAKVSEGAPRQASDSIKRLLNSVNNRFSSKMRISHNIYKSFSARIIEPREI